MAKRMEYTVTFSRVEACFTQQLAPEFPRGGLLN